jgi:hypothetical protein
MARALPDFWAKRFGPHGSLTLTGFPPSYPRILGIAGINILCRAQASNDCPRHSINPARKARLYCRPRVSTDRVNEWRVEVPDFECDKSPITNLMSNAPPPRGVLPCCRIPGSNNATTYHSS